MTPAETVAAQLQPSCRVRVVDDTTIEVTGEVTGPKYLDCRGVTIRFCEGGFSEWPDCIKNGTLADMKDCGGYVGQSVFYKVGGHFEALTFDVQPGPREDWSSPFWRNNPADAGFIPDQTTYVEGPLVERSMEAKAAEFSARCIEVTDLDLAEVAVPPRPAWVSDDDLILISHEGKETE